MEKLEIVIATSNPNKVKEFKELFKDYPIVVTSLKDEGIDVEIIEDGTTFKENSYIKASTIAKYTSKIVIADDSGISVHALDGFPGIMSARFLEGHSYEEKNRVLLEKIAGFADKTAHYTCAISVCNFPGQEDKIFEGICEGTLVEPSTTGHGFGYDPIFMPKGYDITFGVMDDDKKNEISHRAIASQMLLDFIKNALK